MSNTKNNKRTAVLAVILVALMIVGYKVVFVSNDEGVSSIEENVAASQRVESVLAQVESIDFDMSILEDPKFQSLKSIESPLVSLPVGKRNPFSAN